MKLQLRHLYLPSGITEGIPLLIEANWTPEQAIAVVELITDLSEQIWQHYAPQLQEYYRQNRVTENRVPPIDADDF